MRCTISDKDKVNSIMSDDSVYMAMNGEKCDINKCQVLCDNLLKNENVFFLSPNEYSLFIFIPYSRVLYNGHSAILPKGRGRNGIIAGKKAVDWMFKETECLKIFGFTPEYLKAAIRFNLLCGFLKEGVLKKSAVKDGKLYDMVIFGRYK